MGAAASAAPMRSTAASSTGSGRSIRRSSPTRPSASSTSARTPSASLSPDARGQEGHALVGGVQAPDGADLVEDPADRLQEMDDELAPAVAGDRAVERDVGRRRAPASARVVAVAQGGQEVGASAQQRYRSTSHRTVMVRWSSNNLAGSGYTGPVAATWTEPVLADVLAALERPRPAARCVRTLAADAQGRPCGGFGLPVAKSTASHHFRVLREAGVIDQEERGRTRHTTLRREDLDGRYPGLLDLVLREG